MTSIQPVLEQINRFVTLRDEYRDSYTLHCNNVIRYVLDKMKQNDPVFKLLSNGFLLAGSYLDNLKVYKPDEFDILLPIKLPVSAQNNIKLIEVDNNKPGYVRLNAKNARYEMRNVDRYSRLCDRLDDWMNNDGFLQIDKFKSWMQSVVDKAIQSTSFTYESSVYEISKRQSGPARTIHVSATQFDCNTTLEFAIDLVPCFQFGMDTWVKDRSSNIREPYQVIPKARQHDNTTHWISSFAYHERPYIHNLKSLKTLIRLFKKLRDNQNMTNLKSYYIKSIFLWVADEQPKRMWERDLGHLFREMFDVLIENFANKRLPFFWREDFNLVDQLSDYQIDDITRKLKSLRPVIDQNDNDKIIDLFLNQSEKNKLAPTRHVLGLQRTCPRPYFGSAEDEDEEEYKRRNNVQQQEAGYSTTALVLGGVAVAAGLAVAFNLFRNRNVRE